MDYLKRYVAEQLVATGWIEQLPHVRVECGDGRWRRVFQCGPGFRYNVGGDAAQAVVAEVRDEGAAGTVDGNGVWTPEFRSINPQSTT